MSDVRFDPMLNLPHRTFLVLDIGKDQVAVAHFKRRRRGGFELQYLRSAAIEFGYTGDERACEQLSAFLRAGRARFRSARSVTLTLSAHLALTKTINTPAVAGPKRAKIVEFEASQTIPSPLAEVCWDWRVLAEHADGLEVCVAAVKTDLIRRLLGTLAADGLAVERIIPASLALRMVFLRQRPAMGKPALVVCIGRGATQLLYSDGERFATRGLASGCSVETANALANTAAPHPFVQRLISEIARSLVFFGHRDTAAHVPEIHLCGEGPLTNLRSLLAEALACNVHLFEPLETFTVASACADQIVALDRSAITSLAGGALSTELSEDAGLNLMPTDVQARRRFRRRQPALALAAGFSVLALISPAVHLLREQHAVRHALESCEWEQQRLLAARQRGAAYVSRLAKANHATEVLDRIEKVRMAWPTFLAELERCVCSAGDMWLDGLVVKPSGTVATAAPGVAESRPVEIEISGLVIKRDDDSGIELRTKSSEQVRQLLATLRTAPFVEALHSERFESGGPGVLRFAMVLTLNREHAL